MAQKWYNVSMKVKNWNTDIKGFKTTKDKEVWELSQAVNYGVEDQKISLSKLKLLWLEIEPNLDLERARMIKYLIWGKISLLPTNKKFWGLSPKINL